MKHIIYATALALLTTPAFAGQVPCEGPESHLQGPEYQVTVNEVTTVSFLKSCAEVQKVSVKLSNDDGYADISVSRAEDGTYTVEAKTAAAVRIDEIRDRLKDTESNLHIGNPDLHKVIDRRQELLNEAWEVSESTLDDPDFIHALMMNVAAAVKAAE